MWGNGQCLEDESQLLLQPPVSCFELIARIAQTPGLLVTWNPQKALAMRAEKACGLYEGTPVQIQDLVTMVWECGPRKKYAVEYVNGCGDVHAPTGVLLEKGQKGAFGPTYVMCQSRMASVHRNACHPTCRTGHLVSLTFCPESLLQSRRSLCCDSVDTLPGQ